MTCAHERALGLTTTPPVLFPFPLPSAVAEERGKKLATYIKTVLFIDSPFVCFIIPGKKNRRRVPRKFPNGPKSPHGGETPNIIVETS